VGRGASLMRISFLIAAFNEGATIEEVLDRIDALGLDRQIVVVDDGSTDGTADVVQRWRDARGDDLVLVRQSNRGKGAAIRAAIPHVDGEIAVIQDADMEYDPIDVPALIEPIERGKADVVFGSRLSGGRPQRAYLFWHLVGNRFLSLLTNVLFNTTISDMETGYKAFRADVLRSLDLRQNDFGIEAEITARVCRRNLRIYELPVSYYGRTYEEGKKITWRDGLRAIAILVRVRVKG
jgi:glycosyltransferase involved in cell wall biosynthesis